MNASLGYLPVASLAKGNHGDEVNLQQKYIKLCLESRERFIESEGWERCNRRWLFDAAASILNSLSSRQCRSAGDAHSLLLTAPLHAAATPCLTVNGSSIHRSFPNQSNQGLLMPELKSRIKLPYHFTLSKIEHPSNCWSSCCNSLWPICKKKSGFILVWGKSSPIELGGICHDSKPSLSDESTC